MGNLYIREYAFAHSMDIGNIGHEPPVASQSISITSTIVHSEPFNTKTRFVRLYADEDCFVGQGSNPNMPITAKLPEMITVTPGDILAVVEKD